MSMSIGHPNALAGSSQSIRPLRFLFICAILLSLWLPFTQLLTTTLHPASEMAPLLGLQVPLPLRLAGYLPARTTRAVPHILLQDEAILPTDLCTACADPDDPEAILRPLTATTMLTVPKGLSPQDLWSAYAIPAAAQGVVSANGGLSIAPATTSTATVAIVDAGGYPTAERDLNTYSAFYGLPACTRASGCLTVMNEYGKTIAKDLPATDVDWAIEQALDLDMVHAMCPVCKIVLVQADTATLDDLATAEMLALSLHPAAVSNSWGANGELSKPPASCDPFAREYGQCFTQSDVLDALKGIFYSPGTVTTVASGDNGYGADFPADLPWVVAVGGTSLHHNPWTKRGWTEYAWSGTGSGCSAWIPKPKNQMDICPYRTVSDVSFVADPYTGVSIFDSLPYYSTRHKDYRYGWLTVGGTSVGAPAIAGLYGLANNPAALANPSWALYKNEADLNDVLVGSNWPRVKGAYHKWDFLGTAKRGLDGPTGYGTPNGLGAF